MLLAIERLAGRIGAFAREQSEEGTWACGLRASISIDLRVGPSSTHAPLTVLDYSQTEEREIKYTGVHART
ncbi:hypothetical protein VYU27_008262 [Nannochloropsis oceanica]